MDTIYESKINFKQERDFGSLISSSFAFIKQEFSTLVKPLIYIMAPMIVIATLIHGSLPYDSTLALTLIMFLTIVYYVFLGFILQVLIFAYIKNYIEDIGGTSYINVRKYAFKYFFPSLGWSLLNAIICRIASYIFYIPGLYFTIVLHLTMPSIFFNENGKNPFSRSMKLISGNWWFTFGLLLVFGVLLAAVVALFIIPVYFIIEAHTFNGIRNSFGNPFFHPTYLELVYFNVLISVVIVINSLYSILLSFYYFSLVEKMEMPTLMEKIENLIPTTDSRDSFIVEGK